MGNIWWFLIFFFLFLPAAFLFRSFILSVFLKFFNKTDTVIVSLRINSVLWIFISFLYILVEILGVWILTLGLDNKLVDSLKVIFNNFEKLLVFVLIISIFIFVSAVIVQIIRYYVSKSDVPLPNVEIFYNLIRILIGLVGVITALWYLGVPMAPILTTLGVGGLAVSLALQGILSNFFAGMNILFSRVFSKGDYIKVDNQFEGIVEDITWFSTKLVMRNNNRIIIPNSKIVNSILINYKHPSPPMRILVPLSVSYFSDLEKTEKVTLEVAEYVQRNVEGANPDFKPVVRFNSFSDYSINFNVILEVLDNDCQFLVVHEFIKLIKKEYEKQGIEIPFPVRTVYLKENCGKN